MHFGQHPKVRRGDDNVRARACVRACARACACMCVRACVPAPVRARAPVRVWEGGHEGVSVGVWVCVINLVC